MYGQPDSVETPVSHVPNRQPRREFQPRADLEGTYSPYWDGKSPKPYGDRSINVDLGTRPVAETEEEKAARQVRESSQTIQNEKNYKKFFNKQESEDRKRYQPSDMGFGKVGEADTHGDAPDPNEQEEDRLDGFQVLEEANPDIVKRNKEKINRAIDEGQLGTMENPAPNSIEEDEKDHLVGADIWHGDNVDKSFQPLENRFSEIVSRKHLKKINFGSNEEVYGPKVQKDYDTRVIVDRISNHRQKDWLKNHQGEEFIESVWKHAILVELLVDKRGRSCVVIVSDEKDPASKDQNQNKRLKIDTKDFFTMLSVPSIEDGKSCFESRNFRPDRLGDREKLIKFFEHVTLMGVKLGDRKDQSLPPIKIKPWTSSSLTNDRPREASSSEKDTLATLRKYHGVDNQPKSWHENDLTGKTFDKPTWPEKVSNKPLPPVNQRDIWKGSRSRW